jgi:subtilisin family serine protease
MRKRGGLVVVVAAALVLASPAAAINPNDPYWPAAWGQRQVGMPAAWDMTTGSPDVVIAVVDTGVDPTLPDLQGALVPGWDFVENDGTPQDWLGHGTAVATMLVARGNNGWGIAGYCWRCRVMPIRVSAGANDFDPKLAAAGIVYAVDHGARIISLAFNDEGSSLTPEPTIAAAIAYAAQHNVLVVASAGNSGLTFPTHPASDAGAYAVAGTDSTDHLYPWSTFGPWVSLAAPGCQVLMYPGGGYVTDCGNSTSVSAVAGIAALMVSVNPRLTPQQVIAVLQANAVPVAGISGGRVDAPRALRAVGGTVPAPPAPAPPPAAAAHLKAIPPRKQTTHVERGLLGGHRVLSVNVESGRLVATLRSPKAASCSVSLKSKTDVWVAASTSRDAISLNTVVPAGRYRVDVSCRRRQPRRYALYVRALFAS